MGPASIDIADSLRTWPNRWDNPMAVAWKDVSHLAWEAAALRHCICSLMTWKTGMKTVKTSNIMMDRLILHSR